MSLPYRHDVRNLRGQFVEDKLEGHVVMEFFDDSVVVGLAKANRLVGVLRSFSGLGRLNELRMNMTTVRTGKVLCRQDRFGFLRIMTSYGGGEKEESEGNKSSRIIFTKNFGELFNCMPTDSTFFEDCRSIDK